MVLGRGQQHLDCEALAHSWLKGRQRSHDRQRHNDARDCAHWLGDSKIR